MCFKESIAIQFVYLIDNSSGKQWYLQDEVRRIGSCKIAVGKHNVSVQELVTKIQVPILVQTESRDGQIQVSFITVTNCFW